MASDMALEIIGDFSIVWFLSPALCLSGRSSSAFGRWTAALPASALQADIHSPLDADESLVSIIFIFMHF